MPSKPKEPLVFIVYTGLNLNGECSILRIFDKRRHALGWLSQLFGFVEMHEDDILDESEDQGFTWTYLDDIKRDPYFYGTWDKGSLWALVNQDFSFVTEQRSELLCERIFGLTKLTNAT